MKNWTKEAVAAIGSKKKAAKPKAETANRITQNVIRVINMTPGCVAYRINNVGIWDAAKQIHRKANTEGGLPDVWACLRGQFVTIEVKAGRDQLSEDQEKRQFEIERAGGIFLVAHSTDGFLVDFEAVKLRLKNKVIKPAYSTPITPTIIPPRLIIPIIISPKLQSYYIAFEVSNSCNLSYAHKKCPINKKKCGDQPVSDAIIINFIKFCKKHGWNGKLTFHYYNEPLINRGRILYLLKNSGVQCDLWTNGLLLKPNDVNFISLFHKVIITEYDPNHVKQFRHLPNVQIGGGNLDDRIKVYEKPVSYNPFTCLRVYNEIPIDYHGIVHLCCVDWDAQVKIGDLKKDKFEDVLFRFNTLTENITSIKGSKPEVCHKCEWRQHHHITTF